MDCKDFCHVVKAALRLPCRRPSSAAGCEIELGALLQGLLSGCERRNGWQLAERRTRFLIACLSVDGNAQARNRAH